MHKIFRLNSTVYFYYTSSHHNIRKKNEWGKKNNYTVMHYELIRENFSILFRNHINLKKTTSTDL